MALFDPCMEFENFLGQMTSFEVLLKCHALTLSQKFLRLHPAPSKCLSERITWIISRIPRWISKIIFVLGSYELLAMLEGKIIKGFSFSFQPGKITVWPTLDIRVIKWKIGTPLLTFTRLDFTHIQVLIFCVELRELSHFKGDLS